MRSQVLPSLDARISATEAGRIQREVMVELLNNKGDWLDHHMKRLLPPDIYAMAHDYSAPYEAFEARQAKVQKWLKDHDFRIEEHGIGARLFKGKQLISQFLVRFAEQ